MGVLRKKSKAADNADDTTPIDAPEDNDTITVTPEEVLEADTSNTAPKRNRPKGLLERFLLAILAYKIKQSANTQKKKEREQLVRHRKKEREPVTVEQIAHLFQRTIFRSLPYLAPIIAFALWGTKGHSDGLAVDFLNYISEHLALLLIPLLPIIDSLAYVQRNHLRVHPPQQKGKPRKPPLPPFPKLSQHTKDVGDILANLDKPLYRVGYWLLPVISTVVTGLLFPLSIAMFEALPGQLQGAEDALPILAPILIPILVPIFAFLIPWSRCQYVGKRRWDEIEDCYMIAKVSLEYPKTTPRNPTLRQIKVGTPWLAIDVKKWSALYEIDTFFVAAPDTLSVDDVEKWDNFAINLNVKMWRPEEWRVRRDQRGRGAHVGAANYPLSVLWDGECDPDPLTFNLGVNLETEKVEQLTLGDSTPHLVVSGGTSSGKLLRLSTIVKTPTGEKSVGDLNVGDELFDESGRAVRITALSDIETPEKAYRVNFHDGTSVVADPRHLWTTWDRAARVALARQRTHGHERARTPWLTDEQRAILSAEIAGTVQGDDISLPQVAALLGIDRNTFPLVETAQMVGVCRQSTVTREFIYADQMVTQEQTCLVFDRTEVTKLHAYMFNSPSALLREAANNVKVLEKNGSGPVSIPDLTRMTGVPRTGMRSLAQRAGLTLRKEKVTLTLNVPGKIISRTHPKTVHFYPKRPLLEALIQRGLLDGNDQRHKMALPAVRTTQEIADTLRHQAVGATAEAPSWANHSIPRCAPVQFPERDLPLDPYVMGAWLGDGTSTGGGFTSIDPEIWEEVEAAGHEVTHRRQPEGRHIKGTVGALRATDVLDDKHIPDAYLHASVEQRLALLQGLMDTDGSVNRRIGACEFYQSDERMARQVRSLVASLGMIAHIRSKPSGYRNRATGEYVSGKEAWTVEFMPTMQVFRLPRKAALIDPEAVRVKSEHRYIVSVEPANPEPMRCIMVDSDSHQFLVTDQYVPTHNTSLAEIIAAQVLVKPMPWDSNLHGSIVIVDPKGPLARRWRGRPGVVVADGSLDGAEPDDDGNIVTGPMVMADCMQWLEQEHQRRAAVLANYPDVATWVHLPDEVKRAEKFAPIFVILDEYIDHTDLETANGDERIIKENDARNVTTRLASWHARKYRNVGMHTCLIAQRVNMKLIGNVLMGNLPVRAITGQMDGSQLMTMFGEGADVPALPATRYVYENGERKPKTIPGRARIMNSLGQSINKVQIMWFGGSKNSDTLDKWLPRGKALPNGDFSFPEGKPRKPDDFDAEGNLRHVSETDESVTIEEDVSSTAPEIAVPVNDAAIAVTTSDAVFPAAEVAVERCSVPGCVNDSETSCPGCAQPVCLYHMGASPDPTQPDCCETCAIQHPLFVGGVTDVYKHMVELAESTGVGLTVKYSRREDEEPGGVGFTEVTMLTRSRKKVVEVVGNGTILVARSRSGSVEGEAAVMERIDAAVQVIVDRERPQDSEDA